MDTVWSRGTVAECPPTVSGDRLSGPSAYGRRLMLEPTIEVRP
jgi:hypothetical protein